MCQSQSCDHSWPDARQFLLQPHFGAGILADQIACRRIAKSSDKSQLVFGYGFWFEKEKTSPSIALAWPKTAES